MHASKRKYASKMWKLAKYVWARDAWEQKRRNYINLITKIIGMDTFIVLLPSQAWPGSLSDTTPSSEMYNLVELDLLGAVYFFTLHFFVISLLKSPMNFPRPGILSCLALYLPQQTGLTPGGPWWLFVDFLQHVTFLLLGSTLFTI